MYKLIIFFAKNLAGCRLIFIGAFSHINCNNIPR